MKELVIEYSLFNNGNRKRKTIKVADTMEPNVVAAVHRPPFGTIHGVYDTKGKSLYTDEQTTDGQPRANYE